jgi:hypothetical protein
VAFKVHGKVVLAAMFFSDAKFAQNAKKYKRKME